MNTTLPIEERLARKYEIRKQLHKEAWRDKRLVAKWLLWQIWPAILVVFVALFILTPAFVGGVMILSHIDDDGFRKMLGAIFLFSVTICCVGMMFGLRDNPIEKWVASELERRGSSDE